MMIKKTFAFAGILILAFFAAGCSSIVTVSPSTTPITANDSYSKLGYSIGRAKTVVIVGIPFGELSPSRIARDEAIKDKGGNALIEVTEEYNCLSLFLIQFYWTTVEGTAIKFDRKGEIKE